MELQRLVLMTAKDAKRSSKHGAPAGKGTSLLGKVGPGGALCRRQKTAHRYQVPGGQEGSLGRARGKAAGDLKGIWDPIESTLHLINFLKCQSKEGTQAAIWFRGFLDGPGSR